MKYLHPEDIRSYISTQKKLLHWSKNNHNWFQLINKQFEDDNLLYYDDNIDYENYYYYKLLIRYYFYEDYNEESDYKKRYISLQNYEKTNKITNLDHVKYYIKNVFNADIIVSIIENIIQLNNVDFLIEVSNYFKSISNQSNLTHQHIDEIIDVFGRPVAYAFNSNNITNYFNNEYGNMDEYYYKYGCEIYKFPESLIDLINSDKFVFGHVMIKNKLRQTKYGTLLSIRYIVFIYDTINNTYNNSIIQNIIDYKNKKCSINKDFLQKIYHDQFYLETIVESLGGPIYR
jgi:hypothetical protein